jgi:hypothetical protein
MLRKKLGSPYFSLCPTPLASSLRQALTRHWDICREEDQCHAVPYGGLHRTESPRELADKKLRALNFRALDL